jgi:hypothetical protein
MRAGSRFPETPAARRGCLFIHAASSVVKVVLIASVKDERNNKDHHRAYGERSDDGQNVD